MLAKESYKESLPLLAREKYEKKLNTGGSIYPYALAEMWADDVTKWPSIEFPDIVLYLIDTTLSRSKHIVLYLIDIPGEYTREKQDRTRVLRTTIIC